MIGKARQITLEMMTKRRIWKDEKAIIMEKNEADEIHHEAAWGDSPGQDNYT